MKWQSSIWRVLLRTIGALLLLTGLSVAYWWFYKLGPARHTLDPRWVSSHSQQEYWREVQKSIHRGMWSHDDGFAVGCYGDKSWAEWIMNHVKPGTSMGCLGGDPCHSATAMQFITNQDVGKEADAWLDWWKKNRAKSQEEWIADGFAQRGVKIDVPPTDEQVRAVLTLLGKSEASESAAIPRQVSYNAFRYLRDTGFDPVAFVLSHRPISGAIERGLVEYGKWQRFYPEAIGVGALPFFKNDDTPADNRIPAMLTAEFQSMAYTLVFAPLALGSVLMVCSFRKRRRHPISTGSA
jgi:hypothetical protein